MKPYWEEETDEQSHWADEHHWTEDSCLWRCVLGVMVVAVLVVAACLSLPHVLT